MDQFIYKSEEVSKQNKHELCFRCILYCSRMGLSKIVEKLGKNRNKGFILENFATIAIQVQVIGSVCVLEAPCLSFLALPTFVPPGSCSPSIRMSIL